MCCLHYDNATDPVTGVATGAPSHWRSYPTTERPWYLKSISAGSGVWTDPYLFFSAGVLGITAAIPIYDSAGLLLGVAGADYQLDTLEQILQSHVSADANFLLFIVDNDGGMISSNIKGITYNTSTNTRFNAVNSSNAIVANVASRIVNDMNGFGNINETVITVSVPGEENGLHWVQVTELRDEYGLHWHVVVVEKMQCSVGSYLGSESCAVCPDGAVCNGGLEQPTNKDGFWGDLGGGGNRLHEFCKNHRPFTMGTTSTRTDSTFPHTCFSFFYVL